MFYIYRPVSQFYPLVDMKYNFYFFLFFTLITCYEVSAQGENNHWHFGYGHHIDFNAAPPVYAPNSNMASLESCATVSDAQGNLLFYTMGCRIWDRNGDEMPNATGLLGNGPVSPMTGFGIGSSAAGVQVLPHPGNRNQYYVFSVDAIESAASAVYYHLVDMSLNNGLGDVVPGEKNNIVFPQGCTEFTVTARGSCNTFWFIAITAAGKFNAYKIDAHGINLNPVISSPTLGLTDMKYTRITETGIAYSMTMQGLLRTTFDGITGTFSNYELIPGIWGPTFELSPDHQKLYCGSILKQWDLGLYPDIPAITGSAVDMVPGGTNFQNAFMNQRLGPDGKIYLLRTTTGSTLTLNIDRIDQPNAPGLAAGYTPQVFTLASNRIFASLGAHFIGLSPLDTVENKKIIDTLLCKDEPVTLKSPHANRSYLWSNGDKTRETIVNAAGVYYVYSYSPDCKVYSDSFKVTYANLDLDLGNDTLLCAGDTYTLDVSQPGVTTYTWNDGSNAPQKTIAASGTYSVTIGREHCFISDTIVVEVRSPLLTITPGDTFICNQEQVVLQTSSNFESRFSWNTGAEGSTITTGQQGIYVVTARNVCGTQADSVRVAQLNCDCQPTMPSAFSPNGDGKNDVFLPLLQAACTTKSYELHIYNRYGQLVFSSNQPGVGWDGTYLNGRTAELGVYYYILKLEGSYGNRAPVLAKGELTLVR